MARFLDAHTHAHFAAYDTDRDAVIRRALENDVWLVNVGTNRETSAKALEVAHSYHMGVFATIGLHPIHTSRSFHDAQESAAANDGEALNYEAYLEMARDPKTVAIGECGLDYFHIEGDEAEAKRRQKEAFEAQISLSKGSGRPLMIHCRNAFHDLIPILEANREKLLSEPGLLHFFTGTLEEAKRLAELGFGFTFGGAITFARNYDAVIDFLPLDRILSETDAPYVTPAPHRGKRNEPVYVVEVVKKLAELKGVQVEEMKERIMANASRILGIS